MKTNTRILLACCLFWLGTTSSVWCFYNPSTGRWLSRDPIGDASFQTLHEELTRELVTRVRESRVLRLSSYLFVHNNPIGAVDLLGLMLTNTGVERVEAPFPVLAFESHYFLRVDGTSCGFWPKGGKKKLLSLLPFLWVKGHVYSGDPMDAGQTGSPVMLEPCKYDIKKFKACVQGQCYDHDAGRYNLLFHNCWHWGELLIDKCIKASKL